MEQDELLILNNVLVSEDGFKLLKILLLQLGAFERGLNRSANDKEIFMTLGKREKGLWLLDNILNANPEKYMELIKEIKNVKRTTGN